MAVSSHFRKNRELWISKTRSLVSSAAASTLALCLLLGVAFNRASAQATSATLSGVVRDASAAVVAAAKVVLTNAATGVATVTETNGSGVYIFNNVSPGDYSLGVSKQGFASETQASLHILVQQALTQDFQLRPGAVTENVSVEGQAVELNTANASIGSVLEAHTITDIPLNGRNFTELLTLSPGVAPANTGQSGGGGQSNPIGAFSAPSINGAEVRSNYYYLDGIDNTEMNYDVPAIAPIIDDIQEFKVQGHNDEAQFGGVTGAIVNVVTKSGTNKYRGSAWEYIRNTAFNAANPTTFVPQTLVQNQFGFNGGGPLRIPHLYDGRDKSFVFGSYEGVRRAEPTGNATYLVPTAAQLAGDFSALCTEGFTGGVCNNPNHQIYNPFTTTETAPGSGRFTRQPFANNDITSVLNSKAVSFAQAYFPAPGPQVVNSNGVVSNGADARHLLTHQNQWSVRGDENLNASNSGFFRYTNMNQPNTGPAGTTSKYTLLRTVYAKQYVAGYVHSFGPSSILDLEFGHNDLTNSQITRYNGDAASLINAAGLDTGYACNFKGGFANCVLPNLGIPNIASGGEGQSSTLLSNIYQWRANYTKGLGRHSLSLGFNWENDSFHVINTSETITYANNETADPQNSNSGNALAAYLMGVAAQGGRRETVAPLSGQRAGGFYLMDKWKFSDKMTVNLGLRYDLQINGIYGDTKGGTIYVGDMNFNNGTFVLQKAPGSCDTLKAAPCIPGGTLPAHVVVSSDGHAFRPNYNNWQPRVGFAYRYHPKTSIRGGFGIFYDMWGGITQSIQNIGGTWPTTGQITSPVLVGATDVATVNWQSPLSGGLGNANLPAATPFDNVQFYRQPDAKTPYSEQWNIGVEQQLGTSTVLSANYVGSQTHRLIVGAIYNSAVTPGPGNTATVRSRQPYPYISPTFYDRSIGNSHYNALQISLNHQLSRGLSYLVAYTYSKAIDLACDGFFGGEGCSVENPYDLRSDISVSGTDLPQVLSASFLAESPFGKGHRFTTGNSFTDYVVGNWSLNGNFTGTSGLPYNVSESGDSANVNHNVSWDNYNRPDLVGNPHMGNPKPTEWFNTSAFAATAPYTFGNTRRNALRGQRYLNFNSSVFRTFPIGEGRNFQFRAEAFNLFNHPTFGNPDANLGDTNFGKVNSTRSTERQLQFAVKMQF